MKEVITPKCGRENDLVAFLYGELNNVEAQTFQRHVRDCASCNAELAAFRDVRESVVTWRNESLGIISAPISESAVARVRQQGPSALAAVRQFFNLAPLWMKGAVAFASLLFVLFAGLAIARLRDEPAAIVITQGSNANSEQQINALVEKRVQEELQRLKNAPEKTLTAPGVISAGDRSPRQRVARHGNSLASSVPNQKARRPLSKTEREQLASDLRLISGKSDTDLDLLDDRINQ
jgi:anti-sigma factor RsiW